MANIRVVLSTIGKFHTFDLARQLYKRGALAAIFTGYPRFKLKNEGIPRERIWTFPWLHAPYMRLAPRSRPLRQWWEWQDRVSFDRHVARNLPVCDVFCGLSGSALYAGRAAKSEGAKHICDRGSSHIRVQDRILCEEYDHQGIPFTGIDPRIIEREETEYQSADSITVPSMFVQESFFQSGVAREKVKLIPYGVDLSMFYPTTRPAESEFHVLFVGRASVRKGVSYLLAAFNKLQHPRKHLTLVGSISPELQSTVKSLRNRPEIHITGHMPQPRLREIMSACNAMVLPSVEEGFGLVLAQAMACGCPVIASQNTGAQDLFTDGVEGFIVPIRDSDAIADRLQTLSDRPELRAQMGEAAIQRVKAAAGWEHYGEAMYRTFSEMVCA